jgi:hypothetical protein
MRNDASRVPGFIDKQSKEKGFRAIAVLRLHMQLLPF